MPKREPCERNYHSTSPLLGRHFCQSHPVEGGIVKDTSHSLAPCSTIQHLPFGQITSNIREGSCIRVITDCILTLLVLQGSDTPATIM